jgi:hypothetical protein
LESDSGINTEPCANSALNRYPPTLTISRLPLALKICGWCTLYVLRADTVGDRFPLTLTYLLLHVEQGHSTVVSVGLAPFGLHNEIIGYDGISAH